MGTRHRTFTGDQPSSLPFSSPPFRDKVEQSTVPSGTWRATKVCCLFPRVSGRRSGLSAFLFPTCPARLLLGALRSAPIIIAARPGQASLHTQQSNPDS